MCYLPQFYVLQYCFLSLKQVLFVRGCGGWVGGVFFIELPDVFFWKFYKIAFCCEHKKNEAVGGGAVGTSYYECFYIG